MKNIYIIFIFLINYIVFEAKAEVLILDKLDTPGNTTQNQPWIFITDGVMGGISKGSVKVEKVKNKSCYRMIGNVTTENNGGFIQIRSRLSPLINISDYQGIYLKVYGNSKKYFLLLRTTMSVRPQDIYTYSFNALSDWIEIKAPFVEFEKRHYQQENLLNQKLRSIGLVAGFDDYQADICLAEIGLY